MSPTIHTAEVLPHRAMVFLAVVAAHVLIFGYLAEALMRAVSQVLTPQPLTGTILPDVRTPPVDRPQVDEPSIQQPTLAVPPPDIDIRVPVEPEPVIASRFEPEVPVATTGSGGESARVPVPEPIRLVGRNRLPNTEDYYPAQQKRLGVQGVTQVRACVNERGRLSGPPIVEQSSGSAALDAAAVRIARDGQYAKSLRGDTPVPNCFGFRIVFTIGR